ncbi:LemA family protein [Mycobacterium manitobense]|uniref:LemA family protein n=1 Tax=[Mycobacterium] manitobense TaxID=190147 RepID=A0A9X3BY38_9MYCO|nr:LemA family protein [[Mycobacterium] manitobense]MCV7171782.1 LemA family protein [[Mycobacterium] manitobense]
MSWLWWAVLGLVVVVLVSWPIATYNRLVSMQQTVVESWRGIDIELTRRWELVPRLAEVARSYARHEATVLAQLAALRTPARLDDDPSGALQELNDRVIADETRAQDALAGALTGLRALAEAHPDLLASQHYSELMTALRDTDDRIAAARRLYNGNVSRYNAKLRSFPGRVVAGWAGMTTADLWVMADPAHGELPPLGLRD